MGRPMYSKNQKADEKRVAGFVYLEPGDRGTLTVNGRTYNATVVEAGTGFAAVILDSRVNLAAGLKSLQKKPDSALRHAIFAAFRAGMQRSHSSARGARVYRMGDSLITVEKSGGR